MARNKLASIAITFVAGFVAAFLYLKTMTKPPLGGSAVQMAAPTPAADDVAAVRADYERRLADLKTQLDTAKASLASVASTPPPEHLTPAERLQRNRERDEAERAAARDRDNAKLLAAGFSQERIDFIKKRAAELAADFRHGSDLGRQPGLPTDYGAAQAHLIDPDIDLLRELGDEEYTRYRQALGRAIGAKIISILPGGTGDSAGLKVGDEVVSYNGTRVFNIGALGSAMQQTREAGTSMPVDVDVVRNGQKFRVSIPARSNMGIRSSALPSGLPANVQEMLRAVEEMAVENR